VNGNQLVLIENFFAGDMLKNAATGVQGGVPLLTSNTTSKLWPQSHTEVIFI